MTHEEAMSQIGAALPHLDPRVADDQGVIYVRAMIQFVRDADGNLTRQWRYQQVDIGEDEWNPPNKPKRITVDKRKANAEFDNRMWHALGTRAYHVVWKLRPASYEEFAKYTEADLRKIQGCGKVTLNELKEFMKMKGYTIQ